MKKQTRLILGITLGAMLFALSAWTADSAGNAFDRLWKAFDKEYAMFVLRPEVDWAKLRDQYRPRVAQCQSAYEFAELCAEMLRNLRDLHIWVTVADSHVPVFDRPRSANSNPSAHRLILGSLNQRGGVQWAVTSDKIGFLAIYNWSEQDIPGLCDEALERMRDTRGFQPQVPFKPASDAFKGDRDDLLSAALERLRKLPLREKPL